MSGEKGWGLGRSEELDVGREMDWNKFMLGRDKSKKQIKRMIIIGIIYS